MNGPARFSLVHLLGAFERQKGGFGGSFPHFEAKFHVKALEQA